ncbi:hypothetical protein NKDENANG_00753 [Candidatus Entotheonellaceae bacterium PAL068K]
MAFTVYFAGALFNHKDLMGNARLAASIEQVSGGQYVCVLPQHLEQASPRAVDIRNQDLHQVMTCDLALFNFDGSELDSGTVVEFMFAKFLDIPAVIVRSDFRAAGDQGKDGDAWNLMCSFYPRTNILQFNAMAWYHQARQDGASLDAVASRLYQRVAAVLVQELEAVRRQPPLPKGPPTAVELLYRWAVRFPGGGFAEHGSEPTEVEKIISEKRQKGLL